MFKDQISSNKSELLNESSNIISRKPLKQVLLQWIEVASATVLELIGYDLGMVSTNGWLKLVNWLVVEPTHLKKMLVKLGSSSPNRGENKRYLKPPPSYCWLP